MQNDKVYTIEELVLTGFKERFTKVFSCPCEISNAYDIIQEQKRIRGGKPFKYPYAFISMNSIQLGDTFNSHRMGRYGIITNEKGSSGNIANRINTVPVSFELGIRYITNSLYGNSYSVMSFTRNWLMARRFGYLKYTIVYGGIYFNIASELAEQISLPTRENITETESKYDIETSLELKGFISLPIAKTAPLVNDINVQAKVGDITENGVVVGHTFFEYRKKNS